MIFLCLKSMDKLSKMTYSPEQIEALKTEWQQSGLSKKKFTEQHGIKYYTFINWFDRPVKAPGGFMPVKFQQQENLFAEVRMNGKTIRFYQPFPPEYFSILLK
jgi:hypothetical protein